MSSAAATSRPDREPELGIALSGGGFRAAFYHLGVLARLAEVGLLRQVEVISTVSGGSIIGALYYLHVKDLVETIPDDQIGDEHYVWIVECMQRTFLRGVQKHVRARTYTHPGRNFKMAVGSYSRSKRLGEVYEEVFYAPAWDKPLFGAPKPRGDRILMSDLLVAPPGATTEFKPLKEPPRNAPVPILLLNTTALNTGHNWRFEAVKMGEDPRLRHHWVEIDQNMRLETTRLDDLPPEHRKVELGTAVAASSCVPGVFHPVPITGLFRYAPPAGGEPREVEVQLVDGGVHDNQGVCGLIDTSTRQMFVSDASGQMSDEDEPATRVPASLARSTNGIYGDRVREEQLAGVLQRHPHRLVHLKKGLRTLVVPPRPADGGGPVRPRPLKDVGYGLDEEAQRLLSGVRTDLDSFTEVEAYSLACLGYVMTERDVDAPVPPPYRAIDLPRRDPPLAGRWDFDVLRPALAQPASDGELVHQLRMAQQRFLKPVRIRRLPFRVPRLVPPLALVALVVLVLGLLVWRTDLTLGSLLRPFRVSVELWILLLGGVALFLYLRRKSKGRVLKWVSEALYSHLGPFLLALPVCGAAWVMRGTHGLFLRAGTTSRLGLGNPRAAPLPRPGWAPRDCPDE